MKIKRVEKTGGVVVQLGPKETQFSPSSSGSTAGAILPLFHLKRILVPLDFSDCSKKALQYAVPFARQFGAELTLLHVVQPYVPVAEAITFQTEWVQEAQAELQALQKVVGDQVPSKTLVRMGNPHLEIINAVRDLKIDLVILSTHGRTGLEHVLMGSITEKVVRLVSCPVLIVREFEREFIVGASLDEAESAVQK